MSLGGLGTREQGIKLPVLSLLSIAFVLVGVLMFGLELVAYSSGGGGSLQSDVRIAGVQVGGLNQSEAQIRWERIYLDQPITLIYRDSPIIYTPRALGFQTNNEAMLAAARAQSDTVGNFWSGFWSHLLGRVPNPVSVPLDATLQEGQLQAVLEDIARRYDSAASGIGFNLDSLTFQGGVAGAQLDMNGAAERIRAALYNPSPASRVVELPTLETDTNTASMDDLRSAILQYMESQGFLYDGVTTKASLFVMDLSTGAEMAIQETILHSGVSVIKIPLMMNYFRYQNSEPHPDVAYLMSSAIICSHNPGANYIIADTANQNMIQGLINASQTMIDIGMLNSWVTSPLFVGTDYDYPIIRRPSPPIAVDPGGNASADPLNTTTAEDMGIALRLLYDCAYNNSGLLAIDAEGFTQTECVQMLEVMSGVKFFRFSEIGAPQGVRIAHKVGYGSETVADAAIVFSPATDYIFVMFIWEQDTDGNRLTSLSSWAIIDEVSRIVYNYFNPTQPLATRRTPPNPNGGAACVLPRTSAEINLNNMDDNRFDADGIPLASTCYNWPNCRAFDNWGVPQE